MSKLQKSVWLILTVLLIETTVAHAGGLIVVAEGRSDYSIVLAADAIPAEKFAAEELVSHIKQMSGAELKIIDDSGPLPKHAILLGRPRYLAELGVTPDWEQLGKEGYLIRTIKGHLVIAGGQPRGTMYGVYDLLQEYWGCRWFTFDTSHIPQKATLTVPVLDAMNRPVFELREIQQGGYGNWFWDNLDEQYAARVRESGYGPDRAEKYGGIFSIVPNLGHNYRWVVDPDKYGSEHPEYYALRDGKRMNHVIPGTSNDVELCLSNPGTAQAAVETITGWLRESPDVDMIFIGQSDTGKHCQCDNCNAVRKKYGGWDSARRVQIPGNLPESYWNAFGGFAGLQIEFINRVAEALEKEFPNTRIGTYAYYYNRQPPRGIKAHRNVMVLYCPWLGADDGHAPPRCYCHSVDSGPSNDEFSNYGAELNAWTRIANHVYVYDYWVSGWIGQPVNIPTIRRTMRFYRKLGVEGIWLDGMRGIPAGFEWLTFWLWSQLAWNPDFDVDQGIDEFCTAYYGAGAPYIKQYIELACQPASYSMALRPDHRGKDRTKVFTEDPYRPIKYDDLRNCQLYARMLTTTAINRGYELFEKARKAVANDPKARKHVEYTRMGLQTAMLEWLPGTDPRLKYEIELLIRLANSLGFKNAGFGQILLDKYREAIRKKIELETPLYRPRPQATKKKSAFGATLPDQAHYMDGTDYQDLIPKLRQVASLPTAGWLFKDDPKGVGTSQGYFKPNHPTEDFTKIQIGNHWDGQGYAGLEEGWYWLRYKCPELPEGKRVFLRFGAVDESAWLYVDGRLIAWYDTAYPDMTWDKPFLLEVTGSLKSRGKHLLAIRVRNIVGGGGIYKPVSLMVEK